MVPDPVRLVGQRDEVGIAFAGRVELVSLGGGDDLGEEGLAGLGMAGLRQGIGGGRAGLVDLPGGHHRGGRLDAPVPRGAVDVDHRGGVLVGGEGERPLPVEAVLGGDGLVERGRAGRRVVALLAPEAEPVAHLHRPSSESAGPAGESGHAGVDEDPVHVDAAQARAEAVVADHHHGGAPAVSQVAEPADALVEPADDLGRGGVPLGVLDARLVDVQVRPDPVLERVEVLELDHQDRPVRDDLVGQQGAVRAAEEALGRGSGIAP